MPTSSTLSVSELDIFLTVNNFILMYKLKYYDGNAIYHNKNMKL